MAHLTRVAPPEFGRSSAPPATTIEEYEARLAATVERMAQEGLDVLVVYADREHFSDMAHLCGVDPRFEEGVLVLGRDGSRVIYLGNECQDYGPPPELGIAQRLYQEFSPQGQIRDRPVQLGDVWAEVGIGPGTVVGTAGGKYFDPRYVPQPRTAHSLPAYLVDALRDRAGADNVVNAERIFLDPETGLRMTASAREIAQCEYAASVTSDSVRGALAALAPGVRADVLADRFEHRGLPFSAHAMVNFGDKVRRGLSSPTAQTAELGAPYQIALGLRGSLTCRSGAIARSRDDLAPEVADFFPELIANYFDTMVAWYRALRLGASTGEVFAAADAARDPDVFSFALNPGHFLHTEEWSQSTFAAGADTALRSGMLLQGDIIPVVAGPFCAVNIEDGVALADERLRADLQNDHPDVWDRMQRRRRFLAEEIGVALDESVLPLSNMPLWHTPYALDPDAVLVA